MLPTPALLTSKTSTTYRFTRIGPAKGVGPAEEELSRLHSELVRDSLVSHGYAVSAAADAAQVAQKKKIPEKDSRKKKSLGMQLVQLLMERR